MTLTTKAWGTNEVLHSTPAVKICRLNIKPGGFCSVHHHLAKDNTFIVEEGYLALLVEGGQDRVLVPGAHFTVYPGIVHRFRNYSPTPVRVLEVESLSLLSDDDIVRQDEGGIVGTGG